MAFDLGRAFDEAECELANQGRQQDERHAGNGGNDEGAHQDGDELVGIAPAGCLCGKPARTDPEEAEAPIDEIEDQGAHRDGANIIGIRQLPDHRRIDHADDRLGHVGEHDRQSDGEDAPMRYRRGLWGMHGRRLERFRVGVAPRSLALPDC